MTLRSRSQPAYDRRVRGAVVLVVLAGCYAPADYDNCKVSCATGVCPNGFACGADQMCHREGTAACDMIDAAQETCVGTIGLIRNYCPTHGGVLQIDRVGTGRTDGTNCVAIIPQPMGPPICVFGEAETINIAATTDLRFEGPSPVAFVATKEIVLLGVLDVAAGGAGSTNSVPTNASCNPPGVAQPGSGASGGAGGGGAGFASGGGDGGLRVGDTIGTMGAISQPEPMFLRAGCGGGAGGPNLATSTVRAAGGLPGGGIYLLAGERVRIDGQIKAWGGGGQGTAQMGGGGGGGGSGGMIVVDAPTVIIGATGILMAAGGGGGEGCGGVVSGTGGVQSPTNPSIPAPGGTGTTGSDGGPGAGGGSQLGTSATAMSGAGGGGGGQGYIKLFATEKLDSGRIVPPPVI